MEQLLDKLNLNYDVQLCSTFENMLHQEVARVIICDKAYSILQQSADLYEVVYFEPQKEEVSLPFTQPTLTSCTVSNLTSDEVLGLIAKQSTRYIQEMFNNPLLSKHSIKF